MAGTDSTPTIGESELAPVDRIIVNDESEFAPVELHVVAHGPEDAPLILCVHGWPETWHSWHHQIAHFTNLGFRVAAMDVRGYGASSRPKEIAAYRLSELARDTATVLEALSPDAGAILFGHDWGAPIAWNTARLFPNKVNAVAGLSVPYRPATVGDPMELWDAIYADRYFYMSYFQTEGAPEAEFETDLAKALRMTYYAASADAPKEMWLNKRPESTFLEGLIDPEPLPAWIDPAILAQSVDAHARGGLHGVFNRYRAQYLDGDDIEPVGEPILAQPTCFIAGESDMVRSFVPGYDAFSNAGEFLADFRGTTLIADAGHWVQQEKPDETNTALEAFIDSL